jgi:hypothetical protein
MATTNSLIRAIDYNEVQTKIATIFGVGSGQRGYGQTVTSEQMIAGQPIVSAGAFIVGKQYQIVSLGNTNFTAIGAASNTIGVIFTATGIGSGTGTAQWAEPIRASQWNAIKTEMLKVANHAGIASNISVTSVPTLTTGSQVDSAHVTAYETAAAYLDDNRFLLSTSPTEFSEQNFSPSINQSRSTTWTDLIRHSFTVDFGNSNKARWFFNAGGSIRITGSRIGGTVSETETLTFDTRTSAASQTINQPSTFISPEVYSVVSPAGDWNSFMQQNAVWVDPNQESNKGVWLVRHRNLTIPTTGTYTFTHATDDKLRLFVDGVLKAEILDASTSRANRSPASFSMSLTAGVHVLKFEVYNDPIRGGWALQVKNTSNVIIWKTRDYLPAETISDGSSFTSPAVLPKTWPTWSVFMNTYAVYPLTGDSHAAPQTQTLYRNWTAATTGNYKIKMQADNALELWLDNVMIGSVDGFVGEPKTFYYTIAAGPHILKFVHNQRDNPSPAGYAVGIYQPSTGGTTTPQNQLWSNLLAQMGTVVFDHNSTAANSGAGSNIGFYQLTTTPQQVYLKSPNTSVATDYKLTVSCDISNNSNGGARYLYFNAYFRQQSTFTTPVVLQPVCIAVINESSVSLSTMQASYNKFRLLWPNRKIYLLWPKGSYSTSDLKIPSGWSTTKGDFGPIQIPEDNGNTSLRADWYALCNLDQVVAGGKIGVFLDTSGSLGYNKVKASYEFLLSRISARGITHITVQNSIENWIEPFNDMSLGDTTTTQPEPEYVDGTITHNVFTRKASGSNVSVENPNAVSTILLTEGVYNPPVNPDPDPSFFYNSQLYYVYPTTAGPHSFTVPSNIVNENDTLMVIFLGDEDHDNPNVTSPSGAQSLSFQRAVGTESSSANGTTLAVFRARTLTKTPTITFTAASNDARGLMYVGVVPSRFYTCSTQVMGSKVYTGDGIVPPDNANTVTFTTQFDGYYFCFQGFDVGSSGGSDPNNIPGNTVPGDPTYGVGFAATAGIWTSAGPYVVPHAVGTTGGFVQRVDWAYLTAGTTVSCNYRKLANTRKVSYPGATMIMTVVGFQTPQ